MKVVFDASAERYTRLSRMPRLHRGTKVRVTMADGTTHDGFWGGFRQGYYVNKYSGEQGRVGGVAVYSECEVLSDGCKMTTGDRQWLDINNVRKVER